MSISSDFQCGQCLLERYDSLPHLLSGADGDAHAAIAAGIARAVANQHTRGAHEAREQLQHVIEKANAGGDLILTAAFDGELDRNARLGRIALDNGDTVGGSGVPGPRIGIWGTRRV